MTATGSGAATVSSRSTPPGAPPAGDQAAARERGKAIKDHVIAHLDHYLEMFERNATAAGATVHWASDDAEARAIITRICLEADAKLVTRAKSMLGEEIGLPHALADAGIERVETDLAEHIIQLAGERPSHIVWPAMHRTREQVAILFKEAHHPPPAADDPATMVQSARRELRAKFLGADVGISGANFLVADTGATCTVTNEGNAELTAMLRTLEERYDSYMAGSNLGQPIIHTGDLPSADELAAELERAGEVLVEDLIAVLEELEAASRGRAALGLPTPPAPAVIST